MRLQSFYPFNKGYKKLYQFQQNHHSVACKKKTFNSIYRDYYNTAIDDSEIITSCSKNLSSNVLSPGFVPVPSNKDRYSEEKYNSRLTRIVCHYFDKVNTSNQFKVFDIQ